MFPSTGFISQFIEWEGYLADLFIMQVWRINGSSKFAIAAADIGKFYSGDCYLILYSYLGNDRKEEYFLSHWIGKQSTEVSTHLNIFHS
jgi:hypothetical protein